MYVVDLHCDSLSAVSADRPLITPYNISREHPQLQLFAAFVPHRGRDMATRRRELMALANVYASEVSRLSLVSVGDARDLNFAIATDERAAMLTVEGGGGLLPESEELVTLSKMGLRVVGLVWDDNELGSSALTSDDRGLSDLGRRMVTRLCELGMITDVSHMSDKSLADTLELTPYPVIATHSCFRAVADHPRNLTDAQAKRIAARGGIIGLSLYPPHLSGGDTAGREDVIRQLDHGLELLGADALALGCDIDGTDGRYPDFFDTSRSIHDALLELIEERYGADVASRIGGENAIRFLKGNI